ncbi:MAG TPA: type II toxin-antitoxin system RelE/ParE family toxin [Pseudolabrys sp.]|nr:type II toxin-antitoxin system RelE/ParE family toxin [Pseudolabrys sp.]
MTWNVPFHAEFQPEFDALETSVKDELLARLKVLEAFGPQLGRPNVDTLNGSSFHNMKELRFQLDGVWRFAFIFDPKRNAIVLCGGDKENEDSAKFYKQLIATADARYSAYLKTLKPRKTRKA